MLQKEWSNLDKDIYNNLVDCMPRQIAAVIANKTTLQNIKYFYNKYFKFTEIKFPS